MERAEEQSLPVLLREDRGAVSILTLNRPEKLNALSNELISAIVNALDGIELDHAIRNYRHHGNRPRFQRWG